ncbi:MAG: alpha/beta fold hydrolase [Candidatus Bipolaricaulis sp.]|nr:alpha/beta fold hydrolase [Candidatus Bipolaricaulis sp.]MDD5646693.1 alpha/beta fold hydrolase [Candidatus Bipolaricaulis sp.]
MKLAVHRIPGLVLTDHQFAVPLDYGKPDGERVSVFAREVAASGKESADLPWLVFLQGGPGSAAPRPDAASGWLKRALADYRVLLLDQRGTGRSSAVSARSLSRLPDARAQAEHLIHFRADAIVADAERVRRELIGEDTRWTVLGQSYGGFCALHYLSAAPEGLAAALFTGGLPPIDRAADDVYRATYRTLAEKNELYYARYPEDEARARRIADHLAAVDVRLGDGDRLSPRRFQQLGIQFGASDGFERVHYLLEEAFPEEQDRSDLGFSFLAHFDQAFSFQTNPIYAMLHEPIYAQGSATRWAAERIRSEYPEFDASRAGRVLFTGEMIYPWMFDEYKELRPLRAAADLLAERSDWPALYDRVALGQNEVPCAAAIYVHDMYVERAFSEETASAVRGMKTWVTSEYEHNALRLDGERVLGRLLDLVRGVA